MSTKQSNSTYRSVVGLKVNNIRSSHEEIRAELKPFFDEFFYIRQYPECGTFGHDALDHYLKVGWLKGYDPSGAFSTQFYCAAYSDVMTSGLVPLLHYARFGAKEGRVTKSSRPDLVRPEGITQYNAFEIFRRYQEVTFPFHLETARKLIVVAVPPHNTISGGILSMFTIASELKKIHSEHGMQVVIMTEPNKSGLTYCRQVNFRNNEEIYSFDLIVYCSQVEELYLMIPEYATENFITNCSEQIIKYIISRKAVHINILNQNIDLMPSAEKLETLRNFSTTIGQSVAHQAYSGQEWAQKLGLPTMLLPAHISLDLYKARNHAEKEDLIIYSPDESDVKAECLRLLANSLPSYRFIEIRGMTFETYMGLVMRCKFSITFGEGLDFYFLQPIWMGGIGVAIRNKKFFPPGAFINTPNVFEDEQQFLTKIVSFIESVDRSSRRYEALNRCLKIEADKIYSYEYYVSQLKKILTRNYDFVPSS